MIKIKTVLIAVAMLLAVFLVPSAATAATPPIMGVVGDSYTAGFGANGTANWDYNDAWWQTTAAKMGWQVGNVTATPGGGFQQPGQFGTLYQQLSAHPMPTNTDVVLVQGGINDSNGPAVSGEASAVRALIDLIHRQAPNATVVVIGMFNPRYNSLSTNTMLPMARVVGDLNAVENSRTVDAFLLSFEMSGDGTHPDGVGHKQIGSWVAWKMQHALDNGTEFHQTVDGYWVP